MRGGVELGAGCVERATRVISDGFACTRDGFNIAWWSGKAREEGDLVAGDHLETHILIFRDRVGAYIAQLQLCHQAQFVGATPEPYFAQKGVVKVVHFPDRWVNTMIKGFSR